MLKIAIGADPMTQKDNQSAPRDKPAAKAPPCQVTFTVEDKVFSGTSTHFNERGMLILCQEPARLYTRVPLTLRFPGVKSPIKLTAEVVWTNIHGPSDSLSPRGMGVKFLNLDRDMERLLTDLAAQYESYGNLYTCYYG